VASDKHDIIINIMQIKAERRGIYPDKYNPITTSVEPVKVVNIKFVKRFRKKRTPNK
jgi:hypothetical protein